MSAANIVARIRADTWALSDLFALARAIMVGEVAVIDATTGGKTPEAIRRASLPARDAAIRDFRTTYLAYLDPKPAAKHLAAELAERPIARLPGERGAALDIILTLNADQPIKWRHLMNIFAGHRGR